MRLISLRVKNFRGFTDQEFVLHPNFNLIIGENGIGKTSVLEAAAIAIGSWLLGFRGHDSRNIRIRDVRQEVEYLEGRYRELKHYPVSVEAVGEIEFLSYSSSSINPSSKFEQRREPLQLQWGRSLNSAKGKTTQSDASKLKHVAELFSSSVINKEPMILPVIRYFGAGRLWEYVRETNKKLLSKRRSLLIRDEEGDYSDELDKLLEEHSILASAFYGYRRSVDKRCSPDDLIKWMGNERLIEIDEDSRSPALRTVYAAIRSFLPEAKSVNYSIRLKTLILNYQDGRRIPFTNLSDGYRNMIAIVSDIAIKAVMLNPQLGEKALKHTPGVVLIDELDLHLHPKWQRRVIEDLRRTFPKIQFICTTHSPFLIQSLRSGEELIMLEGQPTAEVENQSLEEISQYLMGVSNPEVGQRYEKMKNTAKEYLEALEKEKIDSNEKLMKFKNRLSESIAPYADNPAYQAFLELQRIRKLGE